ncbi:stage VI sporulation protein F [Alteribacillus sp. HJP-4]|uniref:stage VI sporulation protein F n=1 Tax=Alteribacillus sp. HJP-4 TaxID=2775394 RepID=UPI0035CCFEDC
MRERRGDSVFDHISKKTNVKQDDLFQLVQSLQGADFKDEKTVRNVIREVARMAGKRVPKEKEDELVQAITNQNIPMDFASLNKWFQSK